MRLSATRVSYAPDAAVLLVTESPQTLGVCSQARRRTAAAAAAAARIRLVTDVEIH